MSYLERANLSYISLQNMVNHLNEKQNAGSSRGVTLSSQKGDAAGQSALYKPFGLPSRKLGQGETMQRMQHEGCWLQHRESTFLLT